MIIQYWSNTDRCYLVRTYVRSAHVSKFVDQRKHTHTFTYLHPAPTLKHHRPCKIIRVGEKQRVRGTKKVAKVTNLILLRARVTFARKWPTCLLHRVSSKCPCLSAFFADMSHDDGTLVYKNGCRYISCAFDIIYKLILRIPTFIRASLQAA